MSIESEPYQLKLSFRSKMKWDRKSPLLLGLGSICLLFPSAVRADCTSPDGVAGTRDFINSGDEQVMKYCDGTNWIPWAGERVTGGAPQAPAGGGGLTDGDKGDITVGSSGDSLTIDDGAVTSAKTDFIGTLTEGKWCTVSSGSIVCTSDAPSGGAPTGCSSAGETCSDGSKYVTDGLYVTDVNQSTASTWYEAVGMCRDLYRHGRYDWELPGKGELGQLRANRSAIGGFTTSIYWSSSETNSSTAWRQVFSNGSQSSSTKGTDYDVRCIRRN